VVLNANEARERAAVVRRANQIDNDTVAGPLIGAADCGESVATIALGRIDLVPASGLIGHIYDGALAEALERADHDWVALAVRKLVALGFSVAATVQEARRNERKRICIQAIRLSFAMAEEIDPRQLSTSLLAGVVLPAAFKWRRRAAKAATSRNLEATALSLVEVEVERGASRAHLDLRRLAGPAFNVELSKRVAAKLQSRGFQVQTGLGGAELNVYWDD
jgi:hypothetical protein